MKIFGHRGAAGLVAENTLESITKALNYEVDGIEIDVHCCKSGELVVIHDKTLDRTTNGMGNVSEYTLQELQQFETEEGFIIPTLHEVLDIINAQCELNIELKGKNTVLPTVALLEDYIKNTDWEYDHFIISSFDHSQLFELKTITSNFKIGVLSEVNISEVLSIAEALEAFSIHPPIFSLSRDEVNLAQNQGYKIYVWTVNTETQIEQSKSWKVEGIITDFPNFA
ncbi:glycerophosphoryl diester phosphodiesterase [Aquimarina sp. MAR_2010_214]|uniref:glycerophosphodiester phosphodiesterase n=1 Tax=Aquimarina sp. MAR_2010_214 TaxID=1250026 RepID=UPI000C707FDD|nr:glycerophosphodiester phosphodiesterase family protein [Aquimarina sp. MAR_2010_214]PKV48178.1 glycerophosphoryl diester phosphodiesterase [Aquimarina sp. MAR_2010_214]